jgi:hypothetical protein
MDKILVVNSLVQKGIVPRGLEGSFINAPGVALEALNKLGAQLSPKTLEEAVVAVPEQFRARVQSGLTVLSAQESDASKQKDGLVAALKANKRNKVSEDDLKNMSVSALKSLEASLKEVNFSQAAGAPIATVKANADGSGVPAMPKPEDFLKKA